MSLGPKIEISFFLIFPLYFSEFPLYILAAQYQKEQVLNDKIEIHFYLFELFMCLFDKLWAKFISYKLYDANVT